MATRKNNVFTIGLALGIIGVISLLEVLTIISPYRGWWLPVILIVVGILVVLRSRRTVYFLGWLSMVFGAGLLLTTIGLFHLPVLWKIASAYPLLFGLILIL